MRKLLGSISAPVLSRKLRFLHDHGLVHRTVISTPVLRVQYGLTDRGLMVAQLGEPVLLYLRLTDGFYQPSEKFVGRKPTD
jgi:DNA-binding HxlR family transcriptional regulator